MNVLAAIAVLGILCVSELGAKQCTQKDLCSCQFDDGSIMDITSLGRTDNSPAFRDVLAGDEGYYYSYNACFGFTEVDCDDASVCVLNPDKSESLQIGDSGKPRYKYDDDSGDVVVAYTSGTLDNLKQSEVLLVCDPSACTPSIVANGEQKPGSFRLTLTTVCACPNGCSATGPNDCTCQNGCSTTGPNDSTTGPNDCSSANSHMKAVGIGTMLCILMMIVALFKMLT